MAVERMLSVTVIAHQAHADTIVDSLQAAGAIETQRVEIERGGVTRMSMEDERRYSLDEQIARAQFTRDFLGRYREPDVAFGAFISEKIHISLEDYDALRYEEAFDELYVECERIASRLGEIERERTRLEALAHELAPWTPLRLQLCRWSDTENVAFVVGTVPVHRAEEIRQSLRDAVPELSVEEVGQHADVEAWVVMVHASVLGQTRALLAGTEFAEVSFPALTDYPAEERSRALAHLDELAAEEESLLGQATSLVDHYPRAYALVQALLTRRDALEIRDEFAATERTFTIQGWVPKRRRDEVLAALEHVERDVDVTFAEPGPDDRVPVALDNPWYIRPFEVLTDLYGRPTYRDLDPTPLLAGFYFLFFGMCIGDAGYGIVLMLVAYLIKTRLDVAEGVKRFMDLLIAGGLASAIIGVATRSYFSLEAEALPTFLRYEPLLDPVRDIVTLLVVSIAIGVVHVVFGVLVNVYRQFKAGDWPSAVQDDVSSLVLLGGLGITAATGDAAWLAWAALAGVLLKGRVFERLFVDRAPMAALLGIPKGLVGLYGLSGYLSDFLSYTRLAALGMASVLVGQVMNILAGMVSGAPWGIGLVAAALILVVGHAFNIAINLLGAFVHSTRLQFVEFFGKFYEAGGRAFAPFARRTESLVLHPAAGEQEGGTAS